MELLTKATAEGTIEAQVASGPYQLINPLLAM